LNKLIQASDLDQTVCAVIGDSMKNTTSSTDKQVNETLPCSDHVDVYIYQVTLAMGVIFSLTYASIGFSITKFGKRNLMVFWFVLCGTAAVALIWTTNFTLNIVLIVVFLIVGNCGSIMSAISVDIFPTSVRAMALCLVLMIGRLGAMSGSNLIGYLLITNCNLIFVAFGGVLLVCAMIAMTFPADKR
jgi:MFS transporter, VNT family, synaptic vesicle glycoprotein 2